MTEGQTLLVEQNIRLAYHVANREEFLDRDQALSVAMGALMDAAIRWDGRIPFGNFAGVTIKYSLISERRKMRRQKRGGGCAILSLDDGVWDLEDTSLRNIADVVDLNDEIGRKRLEADARRARLLSSDKIVSSRILKLLQTC